jgi:hypothetical protein
MANVLPSPPTTELFAAALDYATRGWRIIPLYGVHDGRCRCMKGDCSSPGKHPLTVHGLREQTTDLQTISTWWKRWPQANVGIATGPASGLWVLDLDGQEGIDSLATLERENEVIKPTPSVQTGGGASHLFFLAAKLG